jgi:hypothetical protein
VQLYSLVPCVTGVVSWERGAGDPRLTIVTKRTYRLEHAFSVASSQEPLYEDDYPAANGSVARPNDLAPFKKKVDCVVVGAAHFGKGPSFSDVEVSFRLGAQINKRVQPGDPNGLAPIPAVWPSRATQRPIDWAPTSSKQLGDVSAVPATFFQCAPSDQQTEAVATGDYLELRHLVAETPRFCAALPSFAPVILMFEHERDMRVLTMRSDLFVIDTDRQVLTVTSRIGLPRLESNTLGIVGGAEHASLQLGEVSAALGESEGSRRLREWFAGRMRARANAIAAESPNATLIHRATTKLVKATTAVEQPQWLSGPRAQPSVDLPPPARWSTTHGAVQPAVLEQSATMVIDVTASSSEPQPVAPPLARADSSPPLSVNHAEAPARPIAVALPSYLKPAPPTATTPGLQPMAPPPVASVESQLSTERTQEESAVSPAAGGGLLTLLFADETKLEQRGTSEALSALVEPAPVSESREIEATDWAKDERHDDDASALELALRVLRSGSATRLEQVGFVRSDDGAPGALLRADLVRLEGQLCPCLSRVSVITATLRLASLALAPVSPERAAKLASLLALMHEDLEFAPDEALAPIRDELACLCDGEERRPKLETLTLQAEALVRSKRCFAPVMLEGGVYIRAELEAGGKRAAVFIPEGYGSSLPDLARFPAVLVARATLASDQPSLVALAAAQRLDESKLTFAPSHSEGRP